MNHGGKGESFVPGSGGRGIPSWELGKEKERYFSRRWLGRKVKVR
jgi:hypothetical protein